MAKPDPAALAPARYPFHCAMATRFGDLDTNMHLNNVAMLGILEDARVRFHHASGYYGAVGKMTTMVASVAIEYLGQAYYPPPLDVHIGIASLGRSSYVLHQLGLQEGRAVSFAQSVMVCVADSRPAPIPPEFIDGVATWMLRS